MDTADIRRRMKEPRVIALSESMQELGDELTNCPTVREIDGKHVLSAGRDRMAAVLLRELPALVVHAFEGTDDEAADLEDDENLRRRHDDRDAILARKVARRERAKQDAAPVHGQNVHETPRQEGRPRSVRREAVEEVAAEVGTTPEAVRKAVARAEAKAAPKPPEPPAPPGYDDVVNGALQQAHREINGTIRTLEAVATPVHPEIGRAVQELKNLRGALERARLVERCPVELHRPDDCPVCGGSGWLTEFRKAGLPKPEGRRGLKAPARQVEIEQPATKSPAGEEDLF